jgi:CheY-like chemotaxis protein
MSEFGSNAVYSSGAVARILGMPPAVFLAWLTRTGQPGDERSLFTRDDIERLRFVKVQMDAGLDAAAASRLLQDDAAAARLPQGADPGARVVILLAERDPYAAELTEFFLRTEGYEVLVALDVDAARREFEVRKPDLVVIDMMISGGTGLDFCRELSAEGNSKILALSTIDLRAQALEAGAEGFLGKPLEPLRLVSMVRDLLGTSALARPSATP